MPDGSLNTNYFTLRVILLITWRLSGLRTIGISETSIDRVQYTPRMVNGQTVFSPYQWFSTGPYLEIDTLYKQKEVL